MIAELAGIEALRSLPAEGLERLARMARQREFPAGALLMRQGDPSESIHFIVRGLVRVERAVAGHPGPLLLAELGAGETVGERGVLYCEPRSATVTALEDTETIELDTSALAMIGLRYPDTGQSLIRMVGVRQRITLARERQATAPSAQGPDRSP